MSDVFISYSRQNIAFAEALFDALSKRQISAWVDWKNIPRSAGWWSSIKRGIDEASTFIFIMSEASLASAVCTLELAHAARSGKRIIPVVIEPPDYDASFGKIAAIQVDDVLKQMLDGQDLLVLARENRTVIGHINWIFFGQSHQGDDDRPFDESLDELIETVKTDLEHNYKHARLLVRAREWEQGGRANDLLLIGQEVVDAEAWLAEADARAKEPTPNELQRDYLATSRTVEDHRRRLLRNLRVGTLTFAAVGIIAVILAVSSLIASQQARAQATDAEERGAVAVTAVAQANNQLTAVPPTLTEVGQQVAAAEEREAAAVTAAAEGQATLDAVNTQVVIVEATVTQAAIIDDISGEFANILLQERDSPAAQIARVNRLIERYPDEPLAWQTRGMIYAEQGDFERALADYERALEFDAQTTSIHINRAGAYFRMGDYERALAEYDRALELDPEDDNNFVRRGNVYLRMSDYERAIFELDRAIEINPDNDRAYLTRGNAYLALGDYDRALNDYDRAIEINPDSSEFHVIRGGAYTTRLGDYERAISDYGRAIEIDPTYAPAYLLRAMAYMVIRDFERAIIDLDRAIDIDPTDAEFYYQRGDAYFDLNDLEAAIADHSRAILLDPQYAAPLIARGNAYVDLNDFDRAFADLNRAIELDPENGFVYFYRGMAGLFRFIETGSFDRETIQADFEMAIALGIPVSDDLQDILNIFGIDLP